MGSNDIGKNNITEVPIMEKYKRKLEVFLKNSKLIKKLFNKIKGR